EASRWTTFMQLPAREAGLFVGRLSQAVRAQPGRLGKAVLRANKTPLDPALGTPRAGEGLTFLGCGPCRGAAYALQPDLFELVSQRAPVVALAHKVSAALGHRQRRARIAETGGQRRSHVLDPLNDFEFLSVRQAQSLGADACGNHGQTASQRFQDFQ